jgi:hypothetical protein
MTSIQWSRRKVTLVAAIVTFTSVGAFLFVELANPKPVPSLELGVDWRCTRTFLLTTCSRARPVAPVVQSSRQNTQCLRRRVAG